MTIRNMRPLIHAVVPAEHQLGLFSGVRGHSAKELTRNVVMLGDRIVVRSDRQA